MPLSPGAVEATRSIWRRRRICATAGSLACHSAIAARAGSPSAPIRESSEPSAWIETDALRSSSSAAARLRASAKKMLNRHPHVFGKHRAKDEDDAYKHWQSRKEQEKSYKDRKSILDGVPKTLPALIKAQKVSKRAAHKGFDWPDVKFVVDKVHEELEEVKAEIRSGNKRRLAEEIGDLLFAIVILSRFGGIDAEESLHSATKKFAKRFGNMERALKKRDKKFTECTFEELYKLWRSNR